MKDKIPFLLGAGLTIFIVLYTINDYDPAEMSGWLTCDPYIVLEQQSENDGDSATIGNGHLKFYMANGENLEFVNKHQLDHNSAFNRATYIRNKKTHIVYRQNKVLYFNGKGELLGSQDAKKRRFASIPQTLIQTGQSLIFLSQKFNTKEHQMGVHLDRWKPEDKEQKFWDVEHKSINHLLPETSYDDMVYPFFAERYSGFGGKYLLWQSFGAKDRTPVSMSSQLVASRYRTMPVMSEEMYSEPLSASYNDDGLMVAWAEMGEKGGYGPYIFVSFWDGQKWIQMAPETSKVSPIHDGRFVGHRDAVASFVSAKGKKFVAVIVNQPEEKGSGEQSLRLYQWDNGKTSWVKQDFDKTFDVTGKVRIHSPHFFERRGEIYLTWLEGESDSPSGEEVDEKLESVGGLPTSKMFVAKLVSSIWQPVFFQEKDQDAIQFINNVRHFDVANCHDLQIAKGKR